VSTGRLRFERRSWGQYGSIRPSRLQAGSRRMLSSKTGTSKALLSVGEAA
jgi:hypothetical protein